MIGFFGTTINFDNQENKNKTLKPEKILKSYYFVLKFSYSPQKGV